MKATEAIEQLEHIVACFGDAEVETPDALEAMWRNPVDRIEFDAERQAVLLVCDRLPDRADAAALSHPCGVIAGSDPLRARSTREGTTEMPRVPISDEYKTTQARDRFERLKLESGEKARLSILEDPWMEWVHEIKAPLIENGEPVKELRTRNNGSTFEANVMEFFTRCLCTGDSGTLTDKGMDPDNCPACESAASGTGIATPRQRFAVNVIKYKLRPSTFDLIQPPSAEILIWSFTDRQYSRLDDLKNDHGDLKTHDIKLVCRDGKFQLMESIDVLVTPAWADAKVKAYISELYGNEENRASDAQLRDSCGQDLARPLMVERIRQAERQYAQAERSGSTSGAVSAGVAQAFAPDLSQGIDGLMKNHPGGMNEFANPDGRRDAESSPERSAQKSEGAEPKSAPAVLDFDSIFGETK